MIKRSLFAISAVAVLFGASLLASASAQETPLCGPPEEEVPATSVGSGNIHGTPGDDVIVGSSSADRITGGPGNDIICTEGGNDVANGGPGDDVVIGDGADLPPFIPSNGDNDDRLMGGPGTTSSPASAGTTRSRAAPETTR